MKKLTKLSLLAALLLGSTLAKAESLHYNGFYLGPKAGGTFQSGNYSSFDTAHTNDVHGAKHSGGASFVGGLNFGYGYEMSNNYYLGFDGSVLFHTLNNELRLSTDPAGQAQPAAKLKNNALYSMAMQVGYKLASGVMPYVSLGLTSGKYEIHLKHQNSASATNGKRGLVAGDYRFSKNMVNFVPGVGMKGKFSPDMRSWTWAVQYDYMVGKTFSKQFTTTNPAETWQYEYKPKQHSLSLALAYQF